MIGTDRKMAHRETPGCSRGCVLLWSSLRCGHQDSRRYRSWACACGSGCARLLPSGAIYPSL